MNPSRTPLDATSLAIGSDFDDLDPVPESPIETAIAVRETPHQVEVPHGKSDLVRANYTGIERLETAIDELLTQERLFNQKGAICALRCGALFHVYKKQLEKIATEQHGQVDFWGRAQDRFHVGRGTISRRMRLVVLWAKENRMGEDVIAELASTAETDKPETSDVLQMAFDFVGEQNTTDLYRKYKLLGGDKPAKKSGKPQLTIAKEVEADREQLYHTARECVAQMRACLAPGYLGQLDATALDNLEFARIDLGHAIAEVKKARKAR
jgi:hypothetical protein